MTTTLSRRLAHKLTAALVVMTVALGAAACGSDDGPTATDSDGQLTTRLDGVYPGSPTSVVPELMKEKGLDVASGADITLERSTQTSSISMASLLSKETDFIISPTETVMAAVAKGAPVVVVASMYTGASVLAVRTQVADGLDVSPTAAPEEKLHALKGLRIGVLPVGTGTHNIFLRYLEAAGLDPAKDVKLVPLGDYGAIVASMKQGKIDAGFAQAGNLEVNIASGQAVSWLSSAGRDFDPLGAEGQMAGVIATRADVVKDHPELVQAVHDAVDATLAEIAQDPDGVGDLVRQKWLTELPDDVFDLMWQSTVKAYPERAVFSEAHYEVATDHAADAAAVPVYDQLVYKGARSD